MLKHFEHQEQENIKIREGQEELARKISSVARFIESQEQRTGKQLSVVLDELRATQKLVSFWGRGRKFTWRV